MNHIFIPVKVKNFSVKGINKVIKEIFSLYPEYQTEYSSAHWKVSRKNHPDGHCFHLWINRLTAKEKKLLAENPKRRIKPSIEIRPSHTQYGFYITREFVIRIARKLKEKIRFEYDDKLVNPNKMKTYSRYKTYLEREIYPLTGSSILTREKRDKIVNLLVNEEKKAFKKTQPKITIKCLE
jgi:hypothetical protein